MTPCLTRASSTSAASSGALNVKLPRLSGKIVRGRRAAGDVGAIDQQHEHVVDAVAMHAFRGGLTRRIAARLDAELVGFDVPIGLRFECAEELAAERKDALHARAFDHVALDRLEPALDAAGQRVVVEALIVRLMRRDTSARLSGARRQGCVPPPPVTVALRQVRVEQQIAPAGRKALPVGVPCRRPPRRGEQSFHPRCGHERKAVAEDWVAQSDACTICCVGHPCRISRGHDVHHIGRMTCPHDARRPLAPRLSVFNPAHLDRSAGASCWPGPVGTALCTNQALTPAIRSVAARSAARAAAS